MSPDPQKKPLFKRIIALLLYQPAFPYVYLAILCIALQYANIFHYDYRLIKFSEVAPLTYAWQTIQNDVPAILILSGLAVFTRIFPVVMLGVFSFFVGIAILDELNQPTPFKQMPIDIAIAFGLLCTTASVLIIGYLARFQAEKYAK